MGAIKTRAEYLESASRLNFLDDTFSSLCEFTDSEDKEHKLLTKRIKKYKSKYPEDALSHPISCIRIEMEDQGITVEDLKERENCFHLWNDFKEIMEGYIRMELDHIRVFHEALGIGYDILCEEYSMPDPLHKDYGKR
jgi:antitoxin component HigA of HigAB toxin-antitoxin module